MKMYILNLDEQIREFPEIWQVRHTESLNGESVLEFMSARKLSKYEHLIYQDADDIWHEFVVSGVDEKHDASGLTFSVFCESVLTELRGDWIDDRRIVNLPASTALERALDGTRWTVGTVDALGNGTVNFYRESAYEALGKIVKTYGGEIQTRITVTDGKITARHVDLLAEIGSNNGARFQWSRNAEEIRREIKRDDVITALHGYGRGEEIGDGFGRRLSFADINGGLSYLADEDARRLYGRVSHVKSWESVTDEFDSWAEVAAGADTWADLPDEIPYSRAHRHGSVLFDDITDAAELKIKTAEVLEQISKPAASYSARVVEFADSGLPRVELGDTVIVIDDDLGIESELRVVEIRRDLLDPTLDEITLGQSEDTIAGTLASQAKIINGLRSVHGVTRMVSEDGKSWIDYSVPEIYLDGDDGNLRIDTDVIFQLHDELGQMVAGFTELGGQKGLFTRFLSNTADGSGGYGTVGWGPSGGLGYQFHHGDDEFMLTFDADRGVQLLINGDIRQAWQKNGGTTIRSLGGKIRIWATEDGSYFIYDEVGNQRLVLTASGSAYIKDANGINRLEINSNGSNTLRDGDGNMRFYQTADGGNYIYNDTGIITFYQDSVSMALQAPVAGGSSIQLTATGATKTVGGVTTDL